MTHVYLCDKKACPSCNHPNCNHTSDIEHAVNFEKMSDDEYWEIKRNDFAIKLNGFFIGFPCGAVVAILLTLIF